MLKTLDILIGGVVVLLLFSMAVTVITQVANALLARKGKYLKTGIANLLQQLGISDRDIAEEISEKVLQYPMIANSKGGLGEVIHREELTKLLLQFAGEPDTSNLSADAVQALQNTLKARGISDPAKTLQNVRDLALQIQASNPQLANNIRDSLALIHEAKSDYVARVNSWFDQTITRVSDRFTAHTHLITLIIATVVVVTVQLDIIGVLNRLSIDEQFRNTIVSDAAKQVSSSTGKGEINAKDYYSLLSTAGLITVPLNGNWVDDLKDSRKYPGMVLAILLISLGAPFWYSVLNQLLKLRSSLAQTDDQQRADRQSTQISPGDGTSDSSPAPDWLVGERGDLKAVG